MDHIQNIWYEIERCLVNYTPTTIILEYQKELPQNKDDEYLPVRKVRTYSQLSVNEREVQSFAAICKIVKILHKHLQTGIKLTTVRDIYYQDVEVFSHKQSECQLLLKQLVEDCFGLSLCKDFNIHPTQKGLVFGDFFEMTRSKTEPMLIPIDYTDCLHQTRSITNTTSLIVIIVEKDSVFQYLCSYLSRHKSLLSNFLVVTGKGYSDGLTLRFLAWLQEKFQALFLGFFDSDVYGINIYKQYHRKLKIVHYCGTYLMDSDPSSWLSILARDISVMINLCNKCLEMGLLVQRELTRGLFLFKKSEINVTNLHDHQLDYVDYILKKVEERNIFKKRAYT